MPSRLAKSETGKRVSHIVSHPQVKTKETTAKLRKAAPKAGGSGLRSAPVSSKPKASFSKRKIKTKAAIAKRKAPAKIATRKPMQNKFGLPVKQKPVFNTATLEPKRLALPAPSEPTTSVHPSVAMPGSPSVSDPTYEEGDLIGPESGAEPKKKIPWLLIGGGVVGAIILWKILK